MLSNITRHITCNTIFSNLVDLQINRKLGYWITYYVTKKRRREVVEMLSMTWT